MLYAWRMEFVAGIVEEMKGWKEWLVKDSGIGSDLAPSIFAIDRSGDVLGYLIMHTPAGSREDQYDRLLMAATILRTGWHAYALAICLEGYLTTRDEDFDADGPSLAERFAFGDQTVHETISVIYRNEDGECEVVSTPYRQTVGRRVEWLDDDARTVNEEIAGTYPWALRQIFERAELRPWVEAVPPEVSMMAVAAQLSDMGFVVASELFDAE